MCKRKKSKKQNENKVDDKQKKDSESSELLNENLDDEIVENTEHSARIAAFKPINFSSYNEGLTHEDSFKLTSGKTDSEKIKISEGFKTTEFFHENSLLTNAEDFAQSIREGTACPIYLKRTNKKTLELIPIEKLKKFAIDLS